MRPRSVLQPFGNALPFLGLALLALGASFCSAASPAGNASSNSSSASSTETTDAGCTETTASFPLLPAVHVSVGSSIQWNSNPPSSGSHYPYWAAYEEYSTAVPRGYYVHDLEHGAIVFLYNCGSVACPDIVAALQAASDSLPDDPLCTAAGEGGRVRTVITPDPLLDVPVAAAAWGYTYTSQCADPAALARFAAQHYGQGPESFCTNGTTLF